MRISQLNLLIALDKYGSFSRAAKELFIAQPSLSTAIKELETELGLQILDRSNKGISFTLQGELVLQKAQTIIAELDSMYQLQDDMTMHGLSKKLRLVAAPFFCNTILSDALIMMKKKYTDFEFDLIHANGGDIVKTLSLEDADLGILLTATNNEAGFISEIRKNDLKHFTLYTDQLCHLVSENHPLCNQEQITIGDILQYPQVFQYNSLLDYTLRDYRRRGYTGKAMIIENLTTLLKYISVTDATSAFISGIYQNATYDCSHIKALYPTDYQIPCKISCVYRKEIAPFIENHFLDVLLKACRKES